MSVAEPQYEIAEPQEAKSPWVSYVSHVGASRHLIGKVVGITFLLTVVIVLLVPSDYQSTARLMPPDKPQLSGMAAMLAAASDEGGAGSGVGGMLADTLGVKSSGALFVGVLRSATIENMIVDRFNLRKVYHERYLSNARERLHRNTEVAEDRKSGIISITATDHTRERAAQIAAAYAECLNQLMAQLNTSAAHRQRLFIEDRLKTAKQELDAADKDLSEFSSKNLTLDVKEQGKAMVTGAAALEEQLIGAESQLSGLEQVYASNNVRVRSLQARVDLLKRKLDELRGAPGAAGAQNDGTGDVGISISRLPLLGVTYFDLYRRAKLQEIVFETLTKQYEMSKIEEAKELPSIKLLDQPEIPELKSGPPRMRIVLLTTLLSFFGVLAWIWARGQWERIDSNDSRKAVILELRVQLQSMAKPIWDALSRRVERHSNSSLS